MNISASTQWSFRPAQMPEEMFVKTFVGREKELNQIFSHINLNLIPSTTPENKKNMIIKAERGIGKTSLFLAIKYKLKAERAEMLNKIVPIFFNEQEDFNTAERLILRIFEIVLLDGDMALYKTLAHPAEWEKGHRSVKENIKKSFEVLKNILTQEEKKLVLFIENFDTLVYRILRKKGSKKAGRLPSQDILTGLVKDPDILMICSVLEDPETPHDYGADTFKVIDLKPVEDFYELIIQRARYDNNLFLLSNKEKLKNKIKAFEYLTGGNTRLMVHLYECLVEKDINKLELMLNDMINKSTPLFEWLLEKFVDYESREILNTLARRGGNATIKEIAKDTYNSENSVRTLLNRLRKKNFVQKINEKRDKSDIYIMAPMMFFIWYQKSVLQRKNIILDFFIHFVDLFFDPTELVDKRRIQQVYQLKYDDQDIFAPYFSYIKKYIEAGKFPLKSSDEKREEEPQGKDSENEKMVYELVRARKDDTALQTRVHKALALKAENQLAESANLFRIAARGYLILSGETKQPFNDRAEDNIRRAIEIYRSLKTEPLETVRCLLILVEILSDTERMEELRLFAQTIIRISKKSKRAEFNPYLGYAYKYLGFVETDAEKKLELFNIALGYFENETKQTIIILINIGLIYKTRKKYETALSYFEKALELSKNQNYFDQLDVIIFFISEVYKKAEDFRGGLNRINEILSWLESEEYEGIKLMPLYNIKAFFLTKTAEFLEAERYLKKGIELAKKENDLYAITAFSINLIGIYSTLNKDEKVEYLLKNIEILMHESIEFPDDLLQEVSRLFLQIGYVDKSLSFFEKLYSKYQALNDAKGQAGMLLNIGLCFIRKNDLTEAKERLHKVMELAETNNLGKILYAANMNYANLLRMQDKSEESIAILEKLVEKDLSGEPEMNYIARKTLFSSYMQRCKEVYNGKDFGNALVYVRKSLKYIEYLAVEDFVEGFYFNMVLFLIGQFGKKVYPFFKEVDLYLLGYYEDKEKGDYIKTFKYVVELVNGKDFDKIRKDLTPAVRDLLGLVNEKLNKDIILEKAEQLIESKKLDKAAELLEDSLKEDERDIKKLKKLAEVYRASSKDQEYFEMLKKAIDYCPEDEGILLELAKYYVNNGKIEDAEKILMELLEKNSKDAEILKHLGDLEKQKKNYKKAIEYIKNAISYSSNEIMKEDLKLPLAQLYLIGNSNNSIQEAEKILGTIKIDKFPCHCNTYRYYFLRTALFMLTQNIEKLKSTLATVLYVVKDSTVDSVCPVRYPDFRMMLKEKLKPREFDCIFHLERMMLSEVSIESFVKKFGESIDSKMVKEINEELQDSGSKIFKRILDEKITENEKITEICGSRLAFESLLFNIRTKFTKLTDHQQEQMISLLTQTLEKLPESYKWLVLDFCSQYLIDLNDNFQVSVVNSLLSNLKEKKDSDEFLKETQSFLQTAKNTLDVTLKKKIKKDLIKIKNEGEK